MEHLVYGPMMGVRSGLDVLVSRLPRLLKGHRVGLLCHQASVTRELTHAVDAVARLGGVRLAALFAPEHGLAGAAQDHAPVGRTKDPATGLPVWSLYGRRLAPSEAMLGDVDALVVDLQDVGSRYYTFVWTMALCLRACARAHVPVLVLDRPNPLGGLVMEGWRRTMSWEDTGLPWVAPSPNMPTPDTARVYPGGCLIEGTNLSEGRGTTRPFELLGAPFLDGRRLARALARRDLPGVTFRAAAFQPAFHKYQGQFCHGVQLHVTDAARFKPFATYLALIVEARRQSRLF